jgi:uncharacterized protein (DUF885 family)
MVHAAAPLPLASRPRRPDGLPEPETPFEAAVVDLLADLFSAYPTWGTAVGYHAVDSRWPDLSAGGRAHRLAMLEGHAARIAAFDTAALSVDERVDQGMLADELAKLRFSEGVLREDAWDPLSLVYVLGSGLFGPLAREYAAWTERGAALLARLERLGDVIAAGMSALTGLPGRPVSLLHLDTALAQLPGVEDLVRQVVDEARARAAAGEGAGLVAPVEAAATSALGAIAAMRDALDSNVRPHASGEGRMGEALFAQRLRHVLSTDLSPDELRRRAWADYGTVRAEMVRLARELWAAWLPAEAMPVAEPGDEEAEGRLVRRVLDAIAQEHQEPGTLLEYCREEMRRIEAFCREHGVITLPEEPIVITWTPRFMRAYGRAFLDSPGPLDRGQRAHFWITPPSEEDGPDAVESYLREDNDRMLRLLCIHEGIPGHYLQLAASNESSSLVRTIFINGMFAEGWAVYVEQVMMDLGYGADDGALLLTHWKMTLRAIVNAILDVETHAGTMTEEQAVDLMVRGAFQEADEARAKWLRARLTAAQLSTYYVGAVQMWDLEREVRSRAADAPDGQDQVEGVAAGIVPGVLPAAPGFDRRAHLEAAIAHGSPSIRWLRRILLG